jgi:ribosome-associated protein
LTGQASPTTEERLLFCINAALQRKAKDLIVLQVKVLSSFADYFMICSGTSDRQVKAIASWLQKA